MDRLEDEMAGSINQRGFGTGIPAPEDEDQMVTMMVQRLYGCIGKLLPTLTLMACRLMGSDGQRGIEQEHTLLCPSRKIAGEGHRLAQVQFYLLEDIDQRRGKSDTIVDGEAKTMSLSRFVIRVLTDNNHLHLMERAEVESIEYQFSRRITRSLGILLTHEVGELQEIRFVKFCLQILSP